MQKLKGLNTLKSNLLIKQAQRNISYSMQFKRYLNGIELKPEDFIGIGKEFKTEMKNDNFKRAVEILGKYNEKTLAKILDFNNDSLNININLNNLPFGNTNKNKNQNTNEDKKTNKENANSENSDSKKEEIKKKNINNFELYNYTKSYQKLFTAEEIAMIKEMSADKKKLVEYLKANSLALDSLILRNRYATSINVDGLRNENKLIYILLAIFIFWLSYDAKGTLKCKEFYFNKMIKKFKLIILNLIFQF